MERIRIAALVLLLPFLCGSSTPPAPVYAEYTFGLSLTTGPNNQLFSLWLVKVMDDEVLGTEPLTREQFLRQMCGRAFSKANQDANNLFREHGILPCIVPEELEAKGVVPSCDVLDNLWKLRMYEWPFLPQEGGHPGLGWAGTPNAPSPAQNALLGTYGVHFPDDVFCYGEDMYRLLTDMGDSTWVETYIRSL